MSTVAPIRTSRADRNLLSWSGDTLQWFLGTDHPQPCERVPEVVLPPDGTTVADWDSALKVSANTYPIYVHSIAAAQCRENVLDINNRAAVVRIAGTFGAAGQVGDQTITIKGGSKDIRLEGEIRSTGRNATIVLGQWSDQSTERSGDIDLSGLYRTDGLLITVIMVRVRRSTVKLPKGAKVLQLKSAAYLAYWHLKRAYVAALSLVSRRGS